MQHQQAAEEHLVEQYLLNEMAPATRDAFEEHFFDCRECASDLKATAAFLDAARVELKRPEAIRTAVVETMRPQAKRPWLLWKPGFAYGALAASLMLVAYQNVFVLPGLTSEVARLEAPEIPATLSLVGASNRGGGVPSVSLDAARSLLLLVEIPAHAEYASYVCQLYSPTQELLWTGQVSAEQAKDTVSIRVPGFQHADGRYALVVHGSQAGAAAQEELARYEFLLHSDSTGLSRK